MRSKTKRRREHAELDRKLDAVEEAKRKRAEAVFALDLCRQAIAAVGVEFSVSGYAGEICASLEALIGRIA